MTQTDQGATVRVECNQLRSLVEAIFRSFELPEEDAAVVADALVLSDLLGVSSHGVSNYIELIYVPGLRQRRINPRPAMQVVRETATTALLDGDGGMGHVVGARAMAVAIDKAEASGLGAVAVRNSRHYGMAGYYALQAIVKDMIGLSLTNADKLVAPTFGRKAVIGTNPIAVAAPTSSGTPFLLDMATSTVPFGKIMLAMRAGVPIPEGWAADRLGQVTTDPKVAFEAMNLLPLGGSYEQGSHKGYGLGVVVDLLSGLLSGAGAGLDDSLGTAVGHFFGALSIEAFQPVEDFKEAMQSFLDRLCEVAPADEKEPVIYAGFKEAKAKQDRLANGIPLHPKVLSYLQTLCGEQGVPFTL